MPTDRVKQSACRPPTVLPEDRAKEVATAEVASPASVRESTVRPTMDGTSHADVSPSADRLSTIRADVALLA